MSKEKKSIYLIVVWFGRPLPHKQEALTDTGPNLDQH